MITTQRVQGVLKRAGFPLARLSPEREHATSGAQVRKDDSDGARPIIAVKWIDLELDLTDWEFEEAVKDRLRAYGDALSAEGIAATVRIDPVRLENAMLIIEMEQQRS